MCNSRFSTAPALAQSDKAPNLVPEEALGFILIKELRHLSDKVEDLATKVNAEQHISLHRSMEDAKIAPPKNTPQ